MFQFALINLQISLEQVNFRNRIYFSMKILEIGVTSSIYMLQFERAIQVLLISVLVNDIIIFIMYISLTISVYHLNKIVTM